MADRSFSKISTRLNFLHYVNNVLYEFYDNAGNLSTCSFDITVYDDEAPSIVCPVHFLLKYTRFLLSHSNLYCPGGIDNCSGQSTVQIAGLVSGATFPLGLTTNTFRGDRRCREFHYLFF